MSPVLYQDTVYFCQDDDLSPALYAVDKRTGKLRWKDDRSDMAVSYSHPVIARRTRAGVGCGRHGKVLGYDLASGKRKWAAELVCRNLKSTPVTRDGSSTSRCRALGFRTNGGRSPTRRERARSLASRSRPAVRTRERHPDAFWKKFERGDVNHDGVLEGDEIDRAFLDPSNQGGILNSEVRRRAGDTSDWRKWDATLQDESSIQAIKGGGIGDVSKTHILWKLKNSTPDALSRRCSSEIACWSSERRIWQLLRN